MENEPGETVGTTAVAETPVTKEVNSEATAAQLPEGSPHASDSSGTVAKTGESEDGKTFKCLEDSCGKVFKSKYSLNRHRLSHLDVKKFQCDFCNKRFILKQYLKEHIYIHTGEKPYECPYEGCNKRFRQAGKLSLHKKTHANQGAALKTKKENPHENLGAAQSATPKMGMPGQQNMGGFPYYMQNYNPAAMGGMPFNPNAAAAAAAAAGGASGAAGPASGAGGNANYGWPFPINMPNHYLMNGMMMNQHNPALWNNSYMAQMRAMGIQPGANGFPQPGLLMQNGGMPQNAQNGQNAAIPAVSGGILPGGLAANGNPLIGAAGAMTGASKPTGTNENAVASSLTKNDQDDDDEDSDGASSATVSAAGDNMMDEAEIKSEDEEDDSDYDENDCYTDKFEIKADSATAAAAATTTTTTTITGAESSTEGMTGTVSSAQQEGQQKEKNDEDERMDEDGSNEKEESCQAEGVEKSAEGAKTTISDESQAVAEMDGDSKMQDDDATNDQQKEQKSDGAENTTETTESSRQVATGSTNVVSSSATASS